MTLNDFCDLLASDAPAPGGGSVAALEGALGIALVHMVAGLTEGKKKYEEYWDLMKEIKQNASAIKGDLVAAIDKDTDAFNKVSEVFAMPKYTDEEKTARKEAMQKALKLSTITPMDTMIFALAGLEAAKSLLGKSNTNAASDLGVAAISLKSAAQGAWLNVLINIGGIKDQEFADRYKARGMEILVKTQTLADEIYSTVMGSLI